MNKEPNLGEFLDWANKMFPDVKLMPYQKELADSLINYRKKHILGGMRSGRTTVVNAVTAYFKEKYPSVNDTNREI